MRIETLHRYTGHGRLRGVIGMCVRAWECGRAGAGRRRGRL